MTRYMLAGLAMTASVVLLFLASFRVAPVPAGVGGTAEQRPSTAAQVEGNVSDVPTGATASQGPASDSRNTTHAVAALQEQIRQASQTLASLESRVTQTRQDLASLQTQKGQAGSVSHAGQGLPPSQPRGTAAPMQAAPVTEPVRGNADSGLPARPAEPVEKAVPADKTAPADKTVRRTAGNVGQPVSANPQGGPDAGALPIQLPGAGHPRPADLRPAEPRTADALPPDARSARVNGLPDVRPGEDDAAQSALNRLRRQSAQGVPAPLRPENAGEPHRVPTTERLADARAAVIEGRLEDARRSLQAAQVQLVFRAVGPGEEQPRVSQATGPISQALLALSTGDRGRAIIAIDQAAGALDPNARSRQFGSLPSWDGSLLPPVPRNAP